MADDPFTAEDSVRRDRYGRYQVVPPDGGKPVGYTRATTIAKTLDDTSALMAWAERMVAIGLSQRPDLLAQVHDLKDDRRALGQLCERAKEHGGATIRRDLGTTLHRILERHWTESGYEPPPAHRMDVLAVDAALEAAGLTVHPEYCETVVVNDHHRIAGTFDLLVTDLEGRSVIADIKTGSSVTYGALGWAVQLSLYATAHAIYEQGPNPTGELDLRAPMPAVAQDHAYIVHVEPGSGICQIHRLRLETELRHLALDVYHARKQRDLLQLVEIEQPVDDSELRAEVAHWAATARQQLVAVWPADIPTPKQQAAPYSRRQQLTIREALRTLRTATDAPWHPDDLSVQPKPTETSPVATAAHTPQPPAAKMPAEGPEAAKQAGEIQQRYNQLDRTQQTWIDTIVKQAGDAQLSISLSMARSTRRVALAQALVHAAQHGWGEAQMHAIYDTVIDNPLTGLEMPLGHKIGALDYRDAKRYAAVIKMGSDVTTTTETTKPGETHNG